MRENYLSVFATVLALLTLMVIRAHAQACGQLTLNAPGSLSGDTGNQTSHCALSPSPDACITVHIPSAGRWTFSTCDNGGDTYNTHMYIGFSACTSDICDNAAGSSQSCGGTEAECHCLDLQAGTYYVTIEGDFSNSGTFFFAVSQCSGNCYDNTLIAPGIANGNTCNQGNDCPLGTGEDVIYRVTIPTTGDWTFSTCNSGGAHGNYMPWLFIGTSCCTADICQSQTSNYCDNASHQWAACPSVHLNAGTYYVTLDQAVGLCSEYELSVQQESPFIEPTLVVQPWGVGIRMSWHPVPTATSYNVYSAPAVGGPFTLLQAVTDTTLSLNLGPDYEVIYRVTAVR